MKRFFAALIFVAIVAGGVYYYLHGTQGLVGNNILVRGLISVTSPSLSNGGNILQKYTCNGQNVSPTLDLERVPGDAKSLVLIVTDIDSLSKNFTHWLVYNINPEVTRIEEGRIPAGGQVALNDYGKREYDGPCPPLGAHRYYFRIYALDTTLQIDTTLDRAGMDKLIKGHIIAKGEIWGEYIKN